MQLLSQPLLAPAEKPLKMKHLLLTTIAAVALVGCGGPSAPDISIHDAAGEGNIEAVKQHIAAGTDVDAKLAHDPGGITPLIVAAASGHKELAELLIANGADVNATDDGGKTPLDSVFGYLELEIVDLLRKHGGKTGDELK